ncbi:hypothetical protein [Tenuibacillus multivorans]|uniref:Uncharacterized protein n=1 Tax=Tenuibacillus multivorans TaxID=237069 RepID=A0A1G9X799_9BACI|nr:hypothetical protein [Tenuibacillus multivorans]GEL78665.1 hypothetical protein TMU01_29000 [Tenuibacillus multivorans]SDM92608.1 hypothetical protein SAMN05216498_1045 [Tenuibacillus multivorans]
MHHSHNEEMNREAQEFIDELERRNAIQHLPNKEKEILRAVESVDQSMALKSKDLKEYLLLNNKESPVERVAKMFKLSPNEVQDILISAQEKVNRLLAKK